MSTSPTSRTAIVTAAGKGIGAACAASLAAAGYDVVVQSRSEACEAVAREIGGVACRGSVADLADLNRLVEFTVERYGRIDALVNNSGHSAKGALLAIDDDQWHDGLDLLVMNVVRLSRLVVPIMRAHGGGAIVNIGSFAALEPDARFPVSSVMRSAMASFTRLFAREFAGANVRMNAVHPGFVDSFPAVPAIVETIPLGRYCTVDEIGATVRFLLSPEAGAITGQNLCVDGGLTRSI